jgi:hypothetical protein
MSWLDRGMRFGWFIIAIVCAAQASAEESRAPVTGFGPYTLGVSRNDIVNAPDAPILLEREEAPTDRFLLLQEDPVQLGDVAFELSLSFEDGGLDRINLIHRDQSASPAQCAQRYRSAVSALETRYGPLDGGRTAFEAPWPAPRIEAWGGSRVRMYSFRQQQGAVIHRAVASLSAGGAVEASSSVWDGGANRVMPPAIYPNALCQIKVEIIRAI